jgi:hypothetical protein
MIDDIETTMKLLDGLEETVDDPEILNLLEDARMHFTDGIQTYGETADYHFELYEDKMDSIDYIMNLEKSSSQYNF